MNERTEQEPSVSAPEEQSPIVEVAKKASRFSREYVATLIAVASTALGVVVALAWNEALRTTLKPLSHRAQVAGFFTYAVMVTAIAVLLIVFMAKVATRIGAEPVQFQYPAPSKDKEKD